jgi:hypothetical protein
MARTKKPKNKLTLIPPETAYVSEKHVLNIPTDDPHLKDRWQLRLYAEKLIEQKLGDEVQLTDLKVKKPGPLAHLKAKMGGQRPTVQLHITLKF